MISTKTKVLVASIVLFVLINRLVLNGGGGCECRHCDVDSKSERINNMRTYIWLQRLMGMLFWWVCPPM